MTVNRWTLGMIALAIPLIIFLVFHGHQPIEPPPPDAELTLMDGSQGVDHPSPRTQRGHGASTLPSKECGACPDFKRDSPPEELALDCLDFMEAAVEAGIPNADATHLGGCLESTPLHTAEDPVQVRVLLEAGADPNAQDRLGRTPLHMAIMFASVETVELLLDAGADPDLVDHHGQDALVYAGLRRNPARDHYISARVITEIAAEVEGLTMEEYLTKHPHEREMLDEYVPDDSELVNISVTLQKRGLLGQELTREIQEMVP